MKAMNGLEKIGTLRTFGDFSIFRAQTAACLLNFYFPDLLPGLRAFVPRSIAQARLASLGGGCRCCGTLSVLLVLSIYRFSDALLRL